MSKESDLKFIHDFLKITLKDACDINKVDRWNLTKGRTSEYKTKLVKDTLDYKIKELYKDESNEDKINK